MNKFIEKYLINNGNISQQEDFMAKLQKLRTNNLDIKYKIRGHDFTELLCFYIKDFLSNEYRNSTPEMLSGVLRGCVNAEELVKEPFFQRLLSRLSSES